MNKINDKPRMVFCSSLSPRVYNMLLNNIGDLKLRLSRKTIEQISNVADGFRIFDTFMEEDIAEEVENQLNISLTNMRSRRLSIYKDDVLIITRLVKQRYSGFGPMNFEEGDSITYYMLEVL